MNVGAPIGGPAAVPGSSGAEPPLLLDTYAWIWWVADSAEMPPSVRRRVQAAFVQKCLWVSSISAWEVALLVQRGRLVLRYPVREWIARCEGLAGLRFLPVDNAIGIRSVELPDLHADPADRLIVASAERLRATLVTRDERLRAYSSISTLWS